MDLITVNSQSSQWGILSLCQLFHCCRLEKPHVQLSSMGGGTGFSKEGLHWSHSPPGLVQPPFHSLSALHASRNASSVPSHHPPLAMTVAESLPAMSTEKHSLSANAAHSLGWHKHARNFRSNPETWQA